MQTRRIMFPIFLIGLIFIFGLSMVNATSNTVYVNTTGSDITGIGTINHPYHTIKKGITNLNNKGTLYIANGTYSGVGNTKITINKNMTVIGRSQTNTMINGQHICWIFHINPGCVVSIKNLKIANGYSIHDGGAIYNNGSTLTVNGTTFSGNTARENGGAIWNDVGKLNILNSIFTGNSVPLGGGAGAIGYNGGTSRLTNSTFKNNSAEIGGAICGWGNLTVTNSTFIFNSVESIDYANGGAICSGSGITKVINSTFYKNKGTGGGAIYSSGLSVTGSIFKGNTAEYGGAIINQGRNLTITNSIFKDNTAGHFGGAICSGAGGLTYVKDSIFTNNSAALYGGGILFFGYTLNVKGSTFTSNTAQNGGAISGGVDDYSMIIVNVSNSTFIDNTATSNGGAIFNSNLGTLNVTCSTFTGNNALNGGSLYTAHGCIVTVISSSFTNNTVTGNGGAIYNEYGTYGGHGGSVNAIFNRFYKNTASSGGDAIYTNGNSFTADNNWWGSNSPDFGSLTGSTLTPTKWLMLRISASTPPTSPGPVLTADLTWNNLDQQTTDGYLANGTPVNFSIISGEGSLDPTNTTTQNGIAKTTYTTTQLGTKATVKVIVDDETLTQDITVN